MVRSPDRAARPSPWQWRESLRREHGPALTSEDVLLPHAHGRVLAAPVRAPEPIPAFRSAAMDGFAVRRSDLVMPGATALPVIADLPARPGQVPDLPPGTAARIMTGAPVPSGADAVIEVEATDADPFGAPPTQVRITTNAPVPNGRHIRAIGEEVTAGHELAIPGQKVGAGLIGLAAQLGITTMRVQRPVRVSIVVTGDELADTASAMPPGMVRESNGEMLTAAVTAAGGTATTTRCGDDPQVLSRVLRELAGTADLLLTTGGIGHGAYDVVKAALGPSGQSTSQFEHLALRPGGPQGRGHIGPVPIVHLPGTPVGALVGFHLFVRPLLDPSAPEPFPVTLIDAEEKPDAATGASKPGVHVRAGSRRLLADGSVGVHILPGKRLAPYATADCLLIQHGPGDSGDCEQLLALPLA